MWVEGERWQLQLLTSSAGLSRVCAETVFCSTFWNENLFILQYLALLLWILNNDSNHDWELYRQLTCHYSKKPPLLKARPCSRLGKVFGRTLYSFCCLDAMLSNFIHVDCCILTHTNLSRMMKSQRTNRLILDSFASRAHHTTKILKQITRVMLALDMRIALISVNLHSYTKKIPQVMKIIQTTVRKRVLVIKAA